MIIVLGSATAREDTYADMLRLSREHVARSLQEPGCLRHSVHPDLQHPLRLVFVEVWDNPRDLAAHFKVPASIAFSKAMAALGAAAPEIQVYDAQAVPLRSMSSGKAA
jgi:quinol monooxygenase YgiN